MSATSAPAPKAYAWGVLSILFFAALFSYTHRLILNVLVDPIRADLSLTDTQVSLLQGAAFALLYGIAGLPLGRWADRTNRRNMIIAGVLVWSLATAMCSVAQGFGMLFAARVGVGLGEAALAPAAISMIADYFPPHRRATAIGLFLMGMVMGNGVAILVGGGLLSWFQSLHDAGVTPLGFTAPWRLVLLTLSAPGLLLAMAMVAVREPPRSTAAGAPVSWRSALDHFKRHALTFVCLFGALALVNAVDYGSSAWTPAFLARNHGLSPGEIGLWLGFGALCGTCLGSALGGVLADHLQMRRGVTAGLVAASLFSFLAIPALSYVALPSAGMAIGVYAVCACLIAMIYPGGIAAVQDAVPAGMRGTTVAVQALIYTSIGLGIGPTGVALISENVFHSGQSVGWAIVLMTAPMLLLASVLLVIARPAYLRTRASLASPEAR